MVTSACSTYVETVARKKQRGARLLLSGVLTAPASEPLSTVASPRYFVGVSSRARVCPRLPWLRRRRFDAATGFQRDAQIPRSPTPSGVYRSPLGG